MVTIKDLLEFIERYDIPPETEIQVISDHSADHLNRIDTEAIGVTGLKLTAEGFLRIDIF